MITPHEITEKAMRLYAKAVSAWLDEDPAFFPYRIACDLRLPKTQSELIHQVDQLRSGSKLVRGFGYSITWEEQAKRLYGKNEYPVAIHIESMEDLVKLIRKASEFRQLQVNVERIRRRFPKLNDWVMRNWQKLLPVESEVNDLLEVTEFMIANPRPGCFTRELPLSISTKLIEGNRAILSAWFDALLPEGAIDYGSTKSFEQRYGFRYLQQHLLLRFLDDEIASEVGCPWLELSLPADQIARLAVERARVFVVENKVNLLTLPKILRGVALGGYGHGVTMLFDVSWLANQKLYYWGDVDVDGFHILASLRHRFPQTQSLFMDLATLEKYRPLAITATTRNTLDGREPEELNDGERAAYRICRANNLRFEQEHIPQAVVNRTFDELVTE